MAFLRVIFCSEQLITKSKGVTSGVKKLYTSRMHWCNCMNLTGHGSSTVEGAQEAEHRALIWRAESCFGPSLLKLSHLIWSIQKKKPWWYWLSIEESFIFEWLSILERRTHHTETHVASPLGFSLSYMLMKIKV